MFMPVKGIYLLIFVIILVTTFLIFYKNIEGWFVFQPQKRLDYSPSDFRLNHLDIYLNTPDGIRVHGWYFYPYPDRPVILFCHGNAGNISHRLEYINLLLDMGVNLFIFDYRGYGKSSGSPSEQGIYTDALSAFDYLVRDEKINPNNIILLGRSLGVAAALEVASKREARSIIIENGFLSVHHMAKQMGIFRLIAPLIPRNYNSLEKIKYVTIPKLIMNSENDEVVPGYMGRQLFEAASEPKEYYEIKGAGHNDTHVAGGREYQNTISEFIRSSKVK
ncbi:MAG: alpha/beta hydrolase [Deltaproteobacteria bacterium]|nr:alpha/beta hydrolase [Deltaproteobacteria bacterium]